jgi:hypothetical protein
LLTAIKNDILEGGLNITNIEFLNKSPKLRQYIRATGSKHPIRKRSRRGKRNRKGNQRLWKLKNAWETNINKIMSFQSII